MCFTQISKLQRVQNAAARLVTYTEKYDHVTPVLYELHWLPVRFRILFKIPLITYNMLGQLPHYINDLISVKKQSAYHLRSSNEILLDFPLGKMLQSFSDRSFGLLLPRFGMLFLLLYVIKEHLNILNRLLKFIFLK